MCSNLKINYTIIDVSKKNWILLDTNKKLIRFDNIRTLTGGLSGDPVFYGENNIVEKSIESSCNKVKFILKFFKTKQNQKTEFNNSNSLFKFNNSKISVHIPRIISYGKIKDNTKKILNENKFYVKSEAVMPSLTYQNAINYLCKTGKKQNQNEIFIKLNTTNQWKLSILQLFNILSVLKLNLFNHCDLHGDNILITNFKKDESCRINLSYLDLKYKKIIKGSKNLLVKLIDFDTSSFILKNKSRLKICPGWKSRFIGTMENTQKSIEIRRGCGVKTNIFTINQIPILDFIKSQIDPQDGDWYYFGHFIEILNKKKILNIPIKNMNKMWKIIHSFSEKKLFNQYLKCKRNEKLLLNYLKTQLKLLFTTLQLERI